MVNIAVDNSVTVEQQMSKKEWVGQKYIAKKLVQNVDWKVLSKNYIIAHNLACNKLFKK